MTGGDTVNYTVNYLDYAAQPEQSQDYAQDAHEAHKTQKPFMGGLDAIQAQLEAEKYYSLLGDARQAVAGASDPGQLAAALTALLFGDDSTEAETVTRMIAACKRPGGYTLAIEAARQRKALLKRQADKLQKLAKELSEQMEASAADEKALLSSEAEAEAADGALLSVMEFVRQIEDAGADPWTVIRKARDLHDQIKGSRAAAGYLLGVLTDWQARAMTDGVTLDLLLQSELYDLKDSLQSAAGQ